MIPQTTPGDPGAGEAHHRWRVFSIVAASLIVIFGAVQFVIGAPRSDPVPETRTVTPRQPTEPPPAAPATVARDNPEAVVVTLAPGTWEVGKDIVSGRYLVTVPARDYGSLRIETPHDRYSLWFSLGGHGDPLDATVDLVVGQTVIVGWCDEMYFEPSGALPFHGRLTAGTWQVGLDLAPGRYELQLVGSDSGNVVVWPALAYYDHADIDRERWELGTGLGHPKLVLDLELGQVVVTTEAITDLAEFVSPVFSGVLTHGMWTVGVDFPAGEWLVALPPELDDDYVFIFAGHELVGSLWLHRNEPGADQNVVLASDGQVFHVRSDSVTLSPP